jgi:antitoxin CptB
MKYKMNIDIYNKSRIHWACRRGMRELDIAIMPFFEHDFDFLSDKDKQRFVRLLECDDFDLFNWLMNNGQSIDCDLQQIILIIQMRHKARGPLAM